MTPAARQREAARATDRTTESLDRSLAPLAARLAHGAESHQRAADSSEPSYYARYFRKRYADKRARGECLWCTEPKQGKSPLCRSCNDKNRVRSRERYRRLKAAR